MPELGESVHEGTVSRWLKKVGDFVKEDEPVVEIMTDKVNTELPSPASGILVKITIPEGADVEVFHEMGLIEPDEAAAKAFIAGAGGGSSALEPTETVQSQATPDTAPAAATPLAPAIEGRRWYTPVVRAMAKEHGVSDQELATIPGSGLDGRVNKKDLEGYLATRGKVSQSPPPPSAPAPTSKQAPEFKPPAAVAAGPDQEIVPLAGMRKMIAEAMVRSSQVPVVSTLIEIDVTTMVEFRTRNKDSFLETYGVKLTYTPFFIKALAETLHQFPMLNASLQDNQITMNKKVHMGCAVSLGKDGEGGLIVPVLRDVDSKSLIEIAKDLETIAAKARGNTLGVSDVQGGTFTITNPGSYGAVLGTPMINAPQAGIAGIYGIIQKPVVINGMIALRHIMNVVLTYDHRIVDGLQAGRFLQAFKQRMENFDFFK
ncbi:MAG: 2-oxo acid dehydrogenase subunit E2 [Fimbriimonadaceae bacterium]|nr:2-oxo acid dehydrogenase subunit E2 [Fimbriimonadaceae bacterium]